MAKNGNNGIFHDPKLAENPVADKRSSSPQHTAVGSGSRPTRSKIPLHDSSPEGAYVIEERKPKGTRILGWKE